MRSNWRTVVVFATLAALAACGSYSAPNNAPMAGADSVGDTTHMPPPPGYSRMK